ncbi:hypothetical protein HQ29_02910 [Porphyromonas canoris]|nr:hypothetical protein HQ29_02910 [Porphyromonas canoris]
MPFLPIFNLVEEKKRERCQEQYKDKDLYSESNNLKDKLIQKISKTESTLLLVSFKPLFCVNRV